MNRGLKISMGVSLFIAIAFFILAVANRTPMGFTVCFTVYFFVGFTILFYLSYIAARIIRGVETEIWRQFK
ncbi:hypothetical protein AciM339_1230 [Aciduliprofundum sp. MAR08-339]|uniref:hypothetical protein n=1 Tax=Aciduliprofundum sp. (strain MAR08-339) TaxID=673860 RepID=UPI0002A4BD34|nr:hypothetical protein AciM339_1230 [Aciduliprofundum sp. MAR08-339]